MFPEDLYVHLKCWSRVGLINYNICVHFYRSSLSIKMHFIRWEKYYYTAVWCYHWLAGKHEVIEEISVPEGEERAID